MLKLAHQAAKRIAQTSLVGFICSLTSLSAKQFGSFTYTDDGTSVTITAYPEDAVGAVEIPAAINALPVTTIGRGAFYSCSGLTSVTIPSSVTRIGDYAFEFCSGLTSVTIPASVTSIGRSAFEKCSRLTSVTIPAGVSSIEDYVFEQCSGLASVTISSGVTSIGEGAFYNCSGLTSVTIPASVSSIGDDAFRSCFNLSFASFLGDAPAMGSDVFASAGSGFTVGFRYRARGFTTPTWLGYQAALSEGLLSYIRIGRNEARIIGYPTTESGPVAIPSEIAGFSVTSIGDSAFYNCSGLTSVTIPSSVTSIGDDAFRSCFGLTEAEFFGDAPTMGSRVFAGASWDFTVAFHPGATGFTTPTWLGYPAVVREDQFTYIVIGGTEVQITDYQPTQSGPVVIPAEIVGLPVTSIGDSAFYDRSGLTSVAIPSSVTSIGDDAFRDCSNLAAAMFFGDAPAMGTDVFTGASQGFTVVFSIGTTGFTTPTWLGYPAGMREGLFTYIVIGGIEVQITDYPTTETGPVVIPTEIAGLPVTSIGDGAFRNCSGLTSVTIPPSVTSIGDSAFGFCYGLASMIIPSSVIGIEDSAFLGCSGLTAITVDTANTEFSSLDGVLLDKSQRTLIQVPGGKSGSYTIPSSVTSIGEGAFYSCSGLTSVTIPSSVTSIGDSAFEFCSGLTSVTIPPSVTSIGRGAFLRCYGLTSVTISSGVTSIGEGAFYNCSGLTSVTIPSSATSIGDGAFSYCSGLTSVAISSGVTNIGDSAFHGCYYLTSVAIPSSVTSIGDDAFRDCSNLAAAMFFGDAPAMGTDVFTGASQGFTVVFSNGTTGFTTPTWLGYPAGMREGLFTYIVIGGSEVQITDYPTTETGPVVIPAEIAGLPVTSIGDGAFRDCSGLTSVTIPPSVISIGIYAFDVCSSLTSVTIPSSVTSIGEGAFSFCAGMTSVTIPSRVTSIGSNTFDGCSGLTTVTIPSSVTSIGSYAFRACSALMSVTIPSSVTNIGDSAFGFCSSLASAFFKGDAPTTDSNVFLSVGEGFNIYFMNGSVGFTSPTWNGYPVVMLDEMPSASGIWLLTHGLPVNANLDQDLNGDGVTLLTAYALNLDPDNAAGDMPVANFTLDQMSITFHGAAAGITYRVETSTDLQEWGTDGVTISELDPATLTRTATVSRDSPRCFVQLRFTLDP